MTAEKTKNLCAQIPEALHAKVRQRQEDSGKSLSEYMTDLITDFYEMEGKGMSDTRTMAIQMPEELFLRLKDYLQKYGLKQKEFVIGLIQQVLADDEAQEQAAE